MLLAAMKPVRNRPNPGVEIFLARAGARAGKGAYNGNSGSRRALRRAVLAEGEGVEGAELQRGEAGGGEPCRITIWAVRRGPSLPARNTLSSRSTLSSSASKVQTSRFGNTSMTPRAALRRPR